MKLQWRKTSSSLCLHMSQAWLTSSSAFAPQECPAVSMFWLERSTRTWVSICVTHDKVGQILPVEISGNGLVTVCADWRHLSPLCPHSCSASCATVVCCVGTSPLLTSGSVEMLSFVCCAARGSSFRGWRLGTTHLGGLQHQISLPRLTHVVSLHLREIWSLQFNFILTIFMWFFGGTRGQLCEMCNSTACEALGRANTLTSALCPRRFDAQSQGPVWALPCYTYMAYVCLGRIVKPQ